MTRPLTSVAASDTGIGAQSGPGGQGAAAEHSWPEVLSAVRVGELSGDQARWAMGRIMRGEASDAQIAAFAFGMRVAGERPEQIRALVEEVLAQAVQVSVEGLALDVVGTGGDRAHSINISTLAAIVAAAAGATVVKHGNRAASSQCGSADVLEALGVHLAQTPEDVLDSLEGVGIGFCFAPMFHPGFKHAAAARKEMAVPTFFNILGPLANPAEPAAALIGCADEARIELMADVLEARGVRALVVRGADGLDEVSTTGPSSYLLAGPHGVVSGTLDPADYGVARATVEDLKGGTPDVNARLSRELLDPARADTPDRARDAVEVNAAAALAMWRLAGGVVPGLEPVGVPQPGEESRWLDEQIAALLGPAHDAIASGRAAELLDRWVALTGSTPAKGS